MIIYKLLFCENQIINRWWNEYILGVIRYLDRDFFNLKID